MSIFKKQILCYVLSLAMSSAVMAEPQPPGNESSDPVTGMQFVSVPGGSFEIGCGSWQSDCFDDEQPSVAGVQIAAFEMGKYEVTQGQWKMVMGSNPSRFHLCGDDCPVEQVSWDDIQVFIHALNGKGHGTFRLPTEAEWEYACRSGGKRERYCGGNDVGAEAWYDKNSGSVTHPVGTKAANGLGLYDMSGNVWEWTCSESGNYNDGHNNYTRCNDKDGAQRVIRGGAWRYIPSDVRSTGRDNFHPNRHYGDLGFRLVRER